MMNGAMKKSYSPERGAPELYDFLWSILLLAAAVVGTIATLMSLLVEL